MTHKKPSPSARHQLILWAKGRHGVSSGKSGSSFFDERYLPRVCLPSVGPEYTASLSMGRTQIRLVQEREGGGGFRRQMLLLQVWLRVWPPVSHKKPSTCHQFDLRWSGSGHREACMMLALEWRS